MGLRHSNITKSLEESADTFFYQVAYMGTIACQNGMGKFGHGHWLPEIRSAEEPRSGTGADPRGNRNALKPWYQGDTIPVGTPWLLDGNAGFR